MKTGILGTGLVFLPEYQYEAVLCMEVLTKYIREEGLELVEYHEMDGTEPASGTLSGTGEAHVAQVLIKAHLNKKEFEQKLVQVFKQTQDQIYHSKLKHRGSFSIGSLSTRVISKAS